MDNDAIRAAQARKGSPFLTTKEAAYFLKLAALTLVKMRMQKRGPKFRKHGRYIRYHIVDLEEWSASANGPAS
ncbi:MAG: helix-turn-helix domain-containing protein [Pseudomonadota bacterium]